MKRFALFALWLSLCGFSLFPFACSKTKKDVISFTPVGASFGTADLDDDEFLDVERIPFDELVHRVMDGEIRDAKTVAAVLKAKVLLGR